jgi:hypothetical protein
LGRTNFNKHQFASSKKINKIKNKNKASPTAGSSRKLVVTFGLGKFVRSQQIFHHLLVIASKSLFTSLRA